MKNPFEVYTSLSNSKKKRPLDWDESAADTQSLVEEVHDSDRPSPAFNWLWLMIIFVFAAISGRLFYLQIIQGPKFRILSENNRVRSRSVLAPRGKIVDRGGQTLAENTASFNLIATPFDLSKDRLNQEVGALASDFLLDSGEVVKKIEAAGKNSIQPLLIKQGISLQESVLFETKSAQYAGFSVQKIPIRQYPNSPAFSHVLGYTGIVSPGDLRGKDQTRYDSVDFIGKSGVEAVYEDYLHGQNGQDLVEVNATGKLLDVLGENSPLPGQTLILNIDKDLQIRLYQGLQASLGQKRGAAVAINPKNGQVLALVSSPAFDNNLFARGISISNYGALLKDKNQPLFNRAIAGQYPPGSTVKPMVASAALQEGVVTEKTIIYDRGVLRVPNQFNPSVSYDFRGWKPGGLGAMNVRSAIAMSSDIYFYTVAGGYPGSAVPEGLGADKLAEYYRKFNLGKTSGIDLQGEQTGLVPDPEWKASYFKNDAILSKWYLGDTYHIGIGQGDLLVTPLQVALWTAAIANDGIGFKPEIAASVVDQRGKTLWENKPEILVSNIASPQNIKIVQEGMRQTVLAGTARPLQSLPISSAGKTGTSQFDGSNPSRTHAWFTAYAPYEDPQIVITVLVEAGGEGNAAAEPIVQNALKWWAENRYKKN